MEEYNTGKSYVDNFTGIYGTVKIENGEYLVIGRNHWVAQGLQTIGSYLSYSTSGASGALYSTRYSIYLGSDTSTPTTVSMTALASPIGTSPGTGPNSTSYSGAYYSSSTTPVVLTYTATWNAGTVSGTLGEVGLYLNINGAGLTGTQTGGVSGLASRMSAADGSFTAFTINTAAALSVTWVVKLVYS